MLLKFKNHYKKIIFDMLSLLPDMNQIARLNQTFKWYQDSNSRILYLWKFHTNNWLGLVGIELEPKLVVVRQLVLVPELANHLSNYFKILDDLQRIYPNRSLMGDLTTAHVFQAWERSH